MITIICREHYWVWQNWIPNESVLHYADMKSLIHCRHLQSLVLLFRCLKGQGPTYLEDFFKIRLIPYNLQEYQTKLDQPRFNTEWAKILSVLLSVDWGLIFQTQPIMLTVLTF